MFSWCFQNVPGTRLPTLYIYLPFRPGAPAREEVFAVRKFSWYLGRLVFPAGLRPVHLDARVVLSV